jgi:hypothetical protein
VAGSFVCEGVAFCAGLTGVGVFADGAVVSAKFTEFSSIVIKDVGEKVCTANCQKQCQAAFHSIKL